MSEIIQTPSTDNIWTFFYLIREHPFDLKGGLCFFGGKNVSEMGRKNILLALCALTNIVFVEKKNNSAALRRK